MTTSFPRFLVSGFTKLLLLMLFAGVNGAINPSNAANAKASTLISQSQDAVVNPTGTRAVAFESVTMKGEPFPTTSTVQYSPDSRTRICVFAMGLDLLPGE